MTRIVGLSGYANVGKDVVGDILVSGFGFERRSVGDVVFDVLAEVDPVLVSTDPSDPLHNRRMSEWIDQRGYEPTKVLSEDFRPMMQRLGGACRAAFGDDVLMDAVLANCPGRMVMTSTRRINEAEAIRSKGGQVWRIERPGFGPINGHVTETELDDYDFDVVIVNDGSIEDLRVKVNEALEGLLVFPS